MASVDILNEEKSVSTIVKIAGPVFLEQVMITLVQYVDTAMVGAIGATATAAIAINKSSIDLANGLIMALGVGITSLMARALGSGDENLAGKYVKMVVTLSLILGSIATILLCFFSPQIPIWLGADSDVLPDAQKYMMITSFSFLFRTATILFTSVYRSFGDTKTPLMINLFMNVINVIGNVLLIYPTRTVFFLGQETQIFGAGMGVAGAAASTSIATVCGGIMMFALAFHPHARLPIALDGGFRLDGALLKKAMTISIPTALERGVMSSTQIMMTWLIAGLGTLPLAAHHIAHTAEAIFFMPGFAFSVAGTTLVAQALGAKREDLAWRFSTKTLKMSVLIMCFAGVALYFMDTFLVGLFSSDPFVVEKGAFCLRLYAFIQPIQVASIAITGCLRGAGDTKTPLYILSFSMLSIRMIGAYLGIVYWGLGVEWVWIMICVDIVVRCVLFLWRYRSKKWMHVSID